jgi:nucleoside-diphosphate-sugar epimerase
MIIDISGSRSNMVFKRMDYSDVALRIPNIKSARDDLGFEPQIELEEGLKRTIEWYRVAH